MAYTATHIVGTSNETSLAKRFVNALWDGLVRLGENSSIMRQIDALNALSDAELAERGLTREEILHRVFAGRMYV